MKKIIEKIFFSQYPGILTLSNYFVERSNFLNFSFHLLHSHTLFFSNERVPTFLLFFSEGKIKRIDRSYQLQEYKEEKIDKNSIFFFDEYEIKKPEIVFTGWRVKLVSWFLQQQTDKGVKKRKAIETFVDQRMPKIKKVKEVFPVVLFNGKFGTLEKIVEK